MTAPHAEARALFEDARQMQAAALERLEAGDIRDAAEKAWCATKRSTDALILAQTGEEPGNVSKTSEGIRALGQESAPLARLRSGFSDAARYLHGDCFYNGRCDPLDFTASLIRGTAQYIADAEALALE